jgi:hypothetical protein
MRILVSFYYQRIILNGIEGAMTTDTHKLIAWDCFSRQIYFASCFSLIFLKKHHGVKLLLLNFKTVNCVSTLIAMFSTE